MKRFSYYDGPRPYPTQSVEEIEEELKNLKEETDNLKDWPEIH